MGGILGCRGGVADLLSVLPTPCTPLVHNEGGEAPTARTRQEGAPGSPGLRRNLSHHDTWHFQSETFP